MARSGGLGWWTPTVRLRCACWTLRLRLSYSNEIGPAVRAAGGRLPAPWLEGVLPRLKQQGPHRVLKPLTWLAARSPSEASQEKLTDVQKREGHMQYPL
jgi:hypothetical protein